MNAANFLKFHTDMKETAGDEAVLVRVVDGQVVVTSNGCLSDAPDLLRRAAEIIDAVPRGL